MVDMLYRQSGKISQHALDHRRQFDVARQENLSQAIRNRRFEKQFPSILKTARKLALQLYPDKNLANKEVATEKFKKINMAGEILTDEKKRKIQAADTEGLLFQM